MNFKKLPYSLLVKICSIVAFVCMFFPLVVVSNGGQVFTKYTGWNLISGIDFSASLDVLAETQQTATMDIMLLVVACMIISAVALSVKNKYGLRIGAIASGLGALATGLFIVEMNNGLAMRIAAIAADSQYSFTSWPEFSYTAVLFTMLGVLVLQFAITVLANIFSPINEVQTTLLQKRAITGYMFLMPFIVGFLLFFLTPAIKSLVFSFSLVDVHGTGGYTVNPAGWYESATGTIFVPANYYRALLVNVDYPTYLLTSIGNLCTTLPLVVIFSFFAAVLLNRAFKGRGFVRAVFFMPVILTSGVILAIETSDVLMSTMQASFQSQVSSSGSTGMQAFELQTMLTALNIPEKIVTAVMSVVNNLYAIISASGVQILVFLAALQSVPRSLYEASSIEGATGWEDFWKITLPMVSPYFVVNIVYTVVDCFTSAAKIGDQYSSYSSILDYIYDVSFVQMDYGLGSAMSWIYFLCIALIMAVVVAIVNRFVFYYDER